MALRWLRRISLTHWILIAMVLGVVVGSFFPESRYPGFRPGVQMVSTLFLRMIKCILVPLVFSTLVVGIAGHSDDLKAVGRLALKALIYFEAVTTVALVIGLAAVNLTKPGVGVKLPPPDANATKIEAKKVTFRGVVEHIVPSSFFEAAAANDVLQVVFFAILFGIGVAQTSGKPRETVVGFF
jgi:proton glutamate symport protein